MPVYEGRYRRQGATEFTSWRSPHRMNTLEELVDAALTSGPVTKDLDRGGITKWASGYDYEFRDRATAEIVWRGCRKGGVPIKGFFLDGSACDPVTALLVTTHVGPARRRFRAAR